MLEEDSGTPPAFERTSLWARFHSDYFHCTESQISGHKEMKGQGVRASSSTSCKALVLNRNTLKSLLLNKNVLRTRSLQTFHILFLVEIFIMGIVERSTHLERISLKTCLIVIAK